MHLSKTIATGALLAFFALPMAPTAQAQSEQVSPARLVHLSGQLFEIALQERDPLLMISAAKLRKSVPLTPVERAPLNADQAPDDVAPHAPISWQDMLDTAAAVAPDNATIAGLIADVSGETTKGVASGQVYSIAKIRKGGRDRYPPLTYEGGKYAAVYVEGAGGSDLNLFVRDEKGRLVCSDTDISAIAYCGWSPAQSAGFTIEVANKSGPSSSYSLITN